MPEKTTHLVSSPKDEQRAVLVQRYVLADLSYNEGKTIILVVLFCFFFFSFFLSFCPSACLLLFWVQTTLLERERLLEHFPPSAVLSVCCMCTRVGLA